MKNLNEIELEYIRNIIEFFCREYPIHIKFDKNSEYKIAQLCDLISRQIQGKLIDTNLLKDHKIQVNVHPKVDRRNVQIENVLEDKNIVLEDNISVFYERRRGEFYEYKCKI